MSLLKYTAEIVRNYVLRNEISPEDLDDLVTSVHRSLQRVSDPVEGTRPSAYGGEGEEMTVAPPHSEQEIVIIEDLEPAVAIENAVTEDAVFCLICGKANKAIRGHLSRTHGMDVKGYREKFNLPTDFPMVAPSYSARRRKLAIDAGLGDKLQAGRKRNRTKK